MFLLDFFKFLQLLGLHGSNNFLVFHFLLFDRFLSGLSELSLQLGLKGIFLLFFLNQLDRVFFLQLFDD